MALNGPKSPVAESDGADLERISRLTRSISKLDEMVVGSDPTSATVLGKQNRIIAAMASSQNQKPLLAMTPLSEQERPSKAVESPAG